MNNSVTLVVVIVTGNWIGDVRNEEDAQLYINILKALLTNIMMQDTNTLSSSVEESYSMEKLLPTCEWAKEYIRMYHCNKHKLE